MAFVERYVTDGAGGGGIGTEGDPWTLAEGLDQAAAGDRVNIQSDGPYSIGADTVTNAGAATQLIVFRGYNSSIGDLEAQGHNADGTLNLTNFPAITLTGTLTPAEWTIFQNLNFSGALSSHLVGSSAVDRWGMLSSAVLNSQNNASARAILSDNLCTFTNNDLECSGASHSNVIDSDASTRVIGCRIKGVADTELLRIQSNAVVLQTLIIGNGTGKGFALVNWDNSGSVIGNCTIYNLGTAIQFPNVINTQGPPILVNNHVTDCGEYINSLYSVTDLAIIEMHNRTRNNTVSRIGVSEEGILVGEIQTIIGGDPTDPDQDYVDADNGNFHLISAAPGKAAGLVAFMDCGAYQREEAGAGGGGLLTHPGMTGGMRG